LGGGLFIPSIFAEWEEPEDPRSRIFMAPASPFFSPCRLFFVFDYFILFSHYSPIRGYKTPEVQCSNWRSFFGASLPFPLFGLYRSGWTEDKPFPFFPDPPLLTELWTCLQHIDKRFCGLFLTLTGSRPPSFLPALLPFKRLLYSLPPKA